MRKLVAVILIIASILVTNVGQFFIQLHFKNEMKESLNGEIAKLEATNRAIGDIVECYTVTATTMPGQEITEESITLQSIPESFINDTYVLDKDALLGKFFRISLDPGTPVTKDTIMDEIVDPTTREIDMVANRWPVGLEVGNYVDFRITYPMGEDFIVLPHLRVYEVNAQSFKVHLTESDIHRYGAALVDYYLNSSKGCDIWISKYVEPGTQEAATSYYAVPANIEAIMLTDPNIVDKALASINKSLRPSIDNAIGSVTNEQQGSLNGGRQETNGKINGDYTTKQQEKEEAEMNGGTGSSWQSPATEAPIGGNTESTPNTDATDGNVVGEDVVE